MGRGEEWEREEGRWERAGKGVSRGDGSEGRSVG